MSDTNAIKIYTDSETIEGIIKDCQICHLSMVDGNKPYLVAMNFGYKDKTLYFHSAHMGKKLEILAENNNVSVFFTTGTEVFYRHHQVACSWRQKYKSVQVFGKVEFIEEYEQKIEALKVFMSNFEEDFEFKFSKPSVDNIKVFKVAIDEWTARSFEY